MVPNQVNIILCNTGEKQGQKEKKKDIKIAYEKYRRQLSHCSKFGKISDAVTVSTIRTIVLNMANSEADSS